MLKKSLETPSHEGVFIRKALREETRLDGRHPLDWRQTNIKVVRSDCRSEADVSIGETRVLVVVTGSICKPFPDRPAEGQLQFSADLCLSAENAGFTQSSVCRMMERSIKESDTIDLESLCIVAGEQVWSISCDIRILSFHGNLIDATNLSVMCGLRAFRKPEVSINIEDEDVVPQLARRRIKIFNEDEREPLPLALHHTPLSVSVGLIVPSDIAFDKNTTQELSKPPNNIYLISDPSLEEELTMDGLVSFSVNAHSEVCSLVKPGGIGLNLDTIMTASDIAVSRAQILHSLLSAALKKLETDHFHNRADRLEKLRRLREAQERYRKALDSNGAAATLQDDLRDGGLNVNDPILRYDYTHETTGYTARD